MSRKLSKDDLEVWRKVARQTEPLFPGRKPPAPPASAKPQVRRVTSPEPPSVEIPEFRVGQSARDTGPARDLLRGTSANPLPEAPLRMGRKAHTRLKRGKLVPEARIDLHGMTIDRAHPALTGFILGAHRDGRRLVLVITGKGRDRDDDSPIPVRKGVLRQQVPHWLSVPPLAQIVLQVTPAHFRHGGGGAYYVYLRRSR